MRLTPLFVFSLALMAGLPAHAEPTMSVTPSKVIEGDPVHIVVSGLRPAQTVTMRSTRTLPGYPTGTETYEAVAFFLADDRGTVDLESSVPIRGSSYDRADPSGLFWSMTAKP